MERCLESGLAAPAIQQKRPFLVQGTEASPQQVTGQEPRSSRMCCKHLSSFAGFGWGTEGEQIQYPVAW